jgi:hypothetical protein
VVIHGGGTTVMANSNVDGRLEGRVTGPAFAQVLDQERRTSHAYGGRSVFGWEPPPRRSSSG